MQDKCSGLPGLTEIILAFGKETFFFHYSKITLETKMSQKTQLNKRKNRFFFVAKILIYFDVNMFLIHQQNVNAIISLHNYD